MQLYWKYMPTLLLLILLLLQQQRVKGMIKCGGRDYFRRVYSRVDQYLITERLYYGQTAQSVWNLLNTIIIIVYPSFSNGTFSRPSGHRSSSQPMSFQMTGGFQKSISITSLLWYLKYIINNSVRNLGLTFGSQRVNTIVHDNSCTA